MQGKLDQQKRQLVVHSSIGRDLRQEQLEEMSNVLGSWVTSSEELLANIESRIGTATKEMQDKATHRKDVAEKIEEVLHIHIAACVNARVSPHPDMCRRGESSLVY